MTAALDISRDPFGGVFGSERGSGRPDSDEEAAIRDWPAYVASRGNVDLAEFAGCFSEGWTNEFRDEDRLHSIGKALGYELIFLWEEYEDGFFSGHSQVAVVCPDGTLREPPANVEAITFGDYDSTVVNAGELFDVLAKAGQWRYEGDAHAVYTS